MEESLSKESGILPYTAILILTPYFFLGTPKVSRREIAEVMGVAGPTISWHMKRLAGNGIFATRRNGKAIRYTLCPAGETIFRHFFGQDARVGEPVGTDGSSDQQKVRK